MKTEKVSILIGLVISSLFMWFGLHYFSYLETPGIQRPYTPFLEGVEVLDLRFNDIKYKLRPSSQSEAPVALITIDDASVREIGRWPWSRLWSGEKYRFIRLKLTNAGAGLKLGKGMLDANFGTANKGQLNFGNGSAAGQEFLTNVAYTYMF